MRGRIEQANSDKVVLRTAFSAKPVTCDLAGAFSLRFGPPASKSERPSTDLDQFYCAPGLLRGHLSFDLPESPLSWRPVGATKPFRLSSDGVARIERNSKSLTSGPSFDEREFPCVLHLKNGEIIPCQVSSYDENTVSFQSPFIKARQVESTRVKAIQFKPLKSPEPDEESSGDVADWLNKILGPEEKTSSAIDPVKLDRALTVPRFKRDNPPSHILVANNGDLKRGKLLAINGETIQFESKLRKLTFPVNRMAQVVNVSKPEEKENESAAIAMAPDSTVRATLADGTTLVFEILESRDGKLRGRSSIFGEMSLPIESITDLNLGDFEKENLKNIFEEWVARPAKAPEFGTPLNSEAPTETGSL